MPWRMRSHLAGICARNWYAAFQKLLGGRPGELQAKRLYSDLGFVEKHSVMLSGRQHTHMQLTIK